MDGRTEGYLRGWINKRVNEQVVGLMVPGFFCLFFCYEFMGANDHPDVANLEPRETVGRVLHR